MLGGAFRKAKYEIRRRRKSKGGQKFLPPNLLPFCPPERKSFNQNSKSGFSSKKVRILTKRHRNTKYPRRNVGDILYLIKRGGCRARTCKGFRPPLFKSGALPFCQPSHYPLNAKSTKTSS